MSNINNILPPADEDAQPIINQMTTNTTKENPVMFDINKCNINVKGHQCKRNRKSGCTIQIDGELIYMCEQHYSMYNDPFITVPVHHMTGIKVIEPKQYTEPCDQWTEIPEWISAGDPDCLTCGFHIKDHKLPTEEEETTMKTVSFDNLIDAIAYAKQTNFHGKFTKGEDGKYHLPVVPDITVNNNIPNKEDTMKSNKKQILCGYCHEHHDIFDQVAACGGKTRVAGAELRKNQPFFQTFKLKDGAWMGKFWLPNHTMAQECIAFYGVKTYTSARNGHGFWVYVNPTTAKIKGDFQGLIAAYKASKS